MWKRTNKPPAAPPAIGNPTLLETSLDEDSAAKLQDLVNVRGGSDGGGGGDGSGSGLRPARTQQQQQQQQQQHRAHEDGHHGASAAVETQTATNAGGTNHLPAIRTTRASSNTPPPTATSKAKPLPDLPSRTRPLPHPSTTTTTNNTVATTASTPSPSTNPPPLNPLASQPPFPSASMSLPPPRGPARPGAHANTLQPERLDIPRSTSGYSHEVSPPDSPRTGDGRSSSPNVSPITDGGGSRGGTSSGNRATAIPAPISSQNSSGSSNYVGGWRDKLSGPSSPVPSRKDSKPTRWDKYSGEPTDSTRGREGQLKPGTNPYERGQMGNSSIVTAGQQPSYKSSLFSQTLRKVGKKESTTGTTAQPREEWKGPSGRHAIVDTPTEKPHSKQKSLPTPSQRRNRQGLRSAKHAGAKEMEQPRPTQQAVNNSMPTSPPLETASEDNAEQPKRRIADEFARENRFAWDAIKSEEPQGRTSSLPPSQVSSPITPSRQAHSNQPSAMNTPQQQNSPATGRGENTGQSILEHQLAQSVQYMGFSNEPGSRFSSTTYSTTLPDSRPDTPEARSIRESPVPMPQSSVLHRKRPIPATVPYPATRSTVKTPSRKPTPSQMQPGAGGGDDESIFNVPPPNSSSPDAEEPPAEVDKVAALEAHINALHKRKMNLTTVINELTNVAQPTSITYDRTSRSEIKKTVNGMTTELASVQKEIHDTGLKLHRALKKRDENMNGEGSGLWVRRVTTE